MNRILIDTDILSYYFKGSEVVIRNFERYLQKFELLEISLITYYEISSGLLAKNAQKQLRIFEDFVEDNLVLPITEKSARISSEIYSILKSSGNLIDDIDLLIAGLAIENDMILATNNMAHFSRIPNLKTINWSRE
jgi:tRNA(fMet)-specific endonuclease VapC